MSFDMYDMVLGDGHQGERAETLLHAVLNLRRRDFGRFRDCWAEVGWDGHLRIAVYTRNGGGNRPAYEEHTNRLKQHPEYLSDVDDRFDSTYATYYFRFPTEPPAHVTGIAPYCDQEFWDALTKRIKDNAPQQPVDTDARWKDALDKIEKEGHSERQLEKAKPMMDALAQALQMPPDPDGAVPIITTDGRTQYYKPEEGS